MEIINDIAFLLHERWKMDQTREDGTYNECWREIKDKEYISSLKEKDSLPLYIKKEGRKYFLNMTNACFLNLSPDLQKETMDKAKLLFNLVHDGNEASKEEGGEFFHYSWVSLNSSLWAGRLDVPFAELPLKNQQYNIDCYEIAYDVFNAREIIEEDVDEYVKKNNIPKPTNLLEFSLLLKYMKEEKINVFYNWQRKGINLYSLHDTMDSCCNKLVASSGDQGASVGEDGSKK